MAFLKKKRPKWSLFKEEELECVGLDNGDCHLLFGVMFFITGVECDTHV